MNAYSLLLALHVCANVVWIGSIAAVGLLVAKSGAAARYVYRVLAVPAFVASFVFGIGLVARDAAGYFHQGWFHAKLTAAIVVIALHHVIGARAKRAEAGTLSGDGGARVMTGVLLVAAAAAVFAVILRR